MFYFSFYVGEILISWTSVSLVTENVPFIGVCGYPFSCMLWKIDALWVFIFLHGFLRVRVWWLWGSVLLLPEMLMFLFWLAFWITNALKSSLRCSLSGKMFLWSLKSDTDADFFFLCGAAARCTQTWATPRPPPPARLSSWEWHLPRPHSRVLKWVLELRMMAASVDQTAPATPAPASEVENHNFKQRWSLPPLAAGIITIYYYK